MGVAGLDHTVGAVSDWERSNAFYRDVVGAELTELARGRYAYWLGATHPDGSLLELLSYA